MPDYSMISLEDLLEALKKMRNPDFEIADGEQYPFDVTIMSEGAEAPKIFGVVVTKDGVMIEEDKKTGIEDAVDIDILLGGVKTLVEMQIGGLEKAIQLISYGSIYTTNPATVQMWFKLFQIGEEALEKALTAVVETDAPSPATRWPVED
ncbi:MAG: hypothetical protein PHU42_02775 [Patescibacteria group bacterium]|nr:hypothetical protein [Patescibacteria group bacterium]